MPIVTKPATSTAWVTVRCVEALVEAEVLPPGALSIICGSPGDLLSKLGAQDVYFEPNGAFTGEVSVEMLADLNVTQVLVGHSERRHVLGEDDEIVNRKLTAAVAGGLGVVLCVGETIENLARSVVELLTHLGERHAARGPVEQPHAERCFESANLLADR